MNYKKWKKNIPLWSLSFSLLFHALLWRSRVVQSITTQTNQGKSILKYSTISLYMWSRSHVIRWHHRYGKGTYSYIELMERTIYNLSLDVVDLLSMSSSFDTHTFAHHAWRTSTTCDNLVAVSACCSISSPIMHQFSNILLLLICYFFCLTILMDNLFSI